MRLIHRRDLSKALLASATGAAVSPSAPAQTYASPCYPQTPVEAAAGVMPTNFGYPPYNVKRYGAAGDGKTDDTTAIQTAIDVLNNWQVYSSALGNKFTPGPDFAQGGEVYLPGGRYMISKPLLLAPNIQLRGACSIRHYGTNYSGSGQLVTVIEAARAFPANAYLIDNGIWRLKHEHSGAALKPYRVTAADDIFNRGSADVDAAGCNFMQSMTVRDMQLDGAGIAFGGIRIQGAAFFDIDGVGVVGTQYSGFAFYACFEFSLGRVMAVAPIPLLICCCESMMQDAGECELYANPTPAWTAANQALINSVFYSFGDQVGSWYGLALKAIIVQWSLNVTFGYLGAHSGNLGIELYRANVNILHWENEYTRGGVLFLLRKSACRCDGLSTKSLIPLSTGDGTSRLVIREPALISCSASFTPLEGESRSAFEVQIHNLKPQPDPTLGVTANLSNTNTRIFPGDAVVDLYVSSSGIASVAGLSDASPTTIDGAMTFIANNSHIRMWRINLAGGQTHTLSSAHSLHNLDVSLVKSGGIDPAVLVNAPLLLVNSRLELAFCRLRSTQSAMFLARGIVNLEMNSASIVIPAACVLVAAAHDASAKVIASGFAPTITFEPGSGMCSGGSNGYLAYEDCFASPSVTGTFALEAVTSRRVALGHTNL